MEEKNQNEQQKKQVNNLILTVHDGKGDYDNGKMTPQRGECSRKVKKGEKLTKDMTTAMSKEFLIPRG